MEDLPPAVTQAIRHTQEVVTVEDLSKIFERKAKPRGYIGLEPSGLFHVGFAVAIRKLNELADLGVRMEILLATWHAQINDKLGGDIERIRRAGEYFKHCFAALNVDFDKVQVKTAEELMERLEYWEDVLRVAKSLSLARVRRSMTIMGRTDEEAVLDFSKLIYPNLQVADIVNQQYEICLGGMDQRRAHVLAREVADKLKLNWKPVGIHTPLLAGLSGESRMEPGIELSTQDQEVATKMSKSIPEEAIFIHDPPRVILKKLRGAYCPAQVIEGNPVLGYVRHLLFTQDSFTFHIKRAKKYGGTLSVTSAKELDVLYSSGQIHPLDLKQATADALTELFQPVREYFEKHPEAEEVKQEVEQFRITK